MEYKIYQKELMPPQPAEPLKAPKDMNSLEELYLAASIWSNTAMPPVTLRITIRRDCGVTLQIPT